MRTASGVGCGAVSLVLCSLTKSLPLHALSCFSSATWYCSNHVSRTSAVRLLTKR